MWTRQRSQPKREQRLWQTSAHPAVYPPPGLGSLALLASIGLHGALLWFMLAAASQLGRTSELSDAVSENTSYSVVIEAMQESQQVPAAQVDMASSAARAGTEFNVAPVDPTEPETLPPVPHDHHTAPLVEPAESPVITENRDIDVIRSRLAEPDLAALSAETPRDPVTKPEREISQRTRRKREQRRGTSGTESATAVAAASKGLAGRKGSAGAVSASRGEILGYAGRVRARVASHKPSGQGARGSAIVAFGVTGSGSLAFARLIRSSGSAGMDQAALAAVRRAAPFPKPPSGARSADLRFSIPFYFQ